MTRKVLVHRVNIENHLKSAPTVLRILRSKFRNVIFIHDGDCIMASGYELDIPMIEEVTRQAIEIYSLEGTDL